MWWGDILFVYALVGLLMVPFRHASNRVLLLAGVVIAVLPPLLSPHVRPLLPELPKQAALYAEALRAFTSSSWTDTLARNIELSNWARIANWPLVCFVLGRFLLGYWAGRTGLLQAPETHRALLWRILVGALLVWASATALDLARDPLLAAWPALDVPAVKLAIRMWLRLGPLALGIAYAAGFALLFLQPGWSRRLGVLAPLGRMALTNYLTQSVLGIALFYGIGLGLGPAGLPNLLLAWAGVLALQLWWSRYWLARFAHGPVEWVWRWASYGRRPPLGLRILEPLRSSQR